MQREMDCILGASLLFQMEAVPCSEQMFAFIPAACASCGAFQPLQQAEDELLCELHAK